MKGNFKNANDITHKSSGWTGAVWDIFHFFMLLGAFFAVELFAYLRKQGFKLCILSNNTKERVHLFNRKLGALAVHKAGKPGIKKLNRALEIMGVTPDSAAMVGDQVFTDMWCGHKAGLLCVMTEPICTRDQIQTKVKRGLERQVMKVYFRKYGE
jgi:HAD superfamily phosphatase (TIGR01668 family)